MANENINNITNDCHIVWLDSHIETDRRSQDIRGRIRQLGRGCLETFVNPDQCIDDITTELIEKKVFLIISNSFGQAIVPLIYELPQIQAIYIYCRDQKAAEIWSKSIVKVSGIFTKPKELLQKLSDDVDVYNKDNNIPMSIFHLSERDKTLQDLSKESVTSIWYRLILRVLRLMVKYGNAKADMITACQASYHDNNAQKRKINDFEKDYSTTRAVWWYTYDSFLYRLLNKALRTQDMEIIFKFRFFINDLQNEIEKLYHEYLNNHSFQSNHHFTVYRSQVLSMTELEHLQQNINELISMNSFLSATLNSEVAALYSIPGDQLNESSALQSVYFIIDVYNINKETTPFAFVEHHSCNSDEKEVLFSMGAIFKVQSVKKHDNIWHIHLELSNEQNQLGQNLLDHMLEQVKSEPGPLSFGWFLFRMSEFDKAKGYAKWMIQQLPPNDIGNGDAYNLLGLIYKDTNKLNESIESYEKALDIYFRLGYQNSPRAIAVHCSLGLAYLASGDSRAADEQQRQAEEKFNSLPIKNLLLKSKVDSLKAKLMADYGYNTIALEKFEQILQNKRQKLLANHPSIGTTLNDIGTVYDKIGNNAKALEYFQQALDIGKKSLTPDHLELVDYHTNVGHVHNKLGQFKLAFEQFLSALQVLVEYDQREDERTAELKTLIADTEKKFC
ncbi:unnamed protein product [Rotaria sp. Silwood1]|nr:unnamed protein product [Rotaria sp. Silwood1]CAF3654075.1 unnamed protein product [Rotaria sp. Silwood1]CAF4759988.1 unnamed protein product [Rotaria sp. Silwood1]CAF4804776.1 unnamed protein product [Rotaria sp. Silwood1]